MKRAAPWQPPEKRVGREVHAPRRLHLEVCTTSMPGTPSSRLRASRVSSTASISSTATPIAELPREELEREVQSLRGIVKELRAAQQKDQQKLRALESQLLLDDQKQAAAGRRRRVSGVLAVIGIIMVTVGTPLALVQHVAPLEHARPQAPQGQGPTYARPPV